MRTIASLKLGEKAIVVNLYAGERLAEKLTDFGFTDGCEVEVLGFAPLGDPILIKVRGSNIALRKDDAKAIEVV